MPLASRLTLVAALLFASGCCGLIFQIAWMRELRLVFGATTAASAAVLAIFMGGLGLGNAVLGRRADRSANPLAMYGLLELGIALSVAISPWLVGWVREMYLAWGGVAALGMPGATAVRLGLSALVLGVPTFLMGGTLPAAARAVTNPGDERRHALATLYGVNTLGAVVGTLAATFFLLEHFGNRTTLWLACAVNVVVGVLAWMVSRRAVRQTFAEPTEIAPSMADRQPALVYFAAGLLGFTFFLMELVWYRMLGPILGGTTFTFGLILAVALLGIGIGGIVYNIVFRRWAPSWSAFAVTCALEALAIAAPYAWGDRIAVNLSLQLQHDSSSFAGLIWDWSRVALVVVFPAALVSGVQFPLLLALVGQGRTRLGRQLGNAYAANTLGSILGSLAGGFGAIPLLTAVGAWKLVVALLLALACLIQWRAIRGTTHATKLLPFALICALALVCLWQPGPTAAWRHSGIGAGRSTLGATDANSIQQWLNTCRRRLIWEADGVESSIGLMRINGLSFFVNGKSDGNSLGDAATQVGLALLGAMLHPEPRTALVVGMGTGETCGWLADMRSIQRVDVVELEPAIDHVAHECSDVNRQALANPRVVRIYNDAREAILTTSAKYDLILSEPSNPYRAGVATLFTREFYQAVNQRLNEGGLFLQWVQAYEIEDTTLNTVLATLAAEFAHVEIWQGRPNDLLVVCSNTPPSYTVEQLRERMASGATQEALRKVWRITDVEGFLAQFLANDGYVRSVAAPQALALNTDDRTILEYLFAKSVGNRYEISLEQLRQAAVAAGQHRPTSLAAGVDWDRVELRRIAYSTIVGRNLLDSNNYFEQQNQLVEALTAYLDLDYKLALQIWPQDLASLGYVDLVALAQCHAELGRPAALDYAAQIEQFSAADADAVRAVYAWKSGQADALAQTERAIRHWQHEPWGVGVLWERVLVAISELTRNKPELARPIYELFQTPFAGDRFDEERQLIRADLAILLDPAALVEILESWEPHVPWEEGVLEARKVAYQLTDHPRKHEAAADLDTFRGNSGTDP